MEHVDTVVVGAGIIGLAIARALALKGEDVLVLESENAIGSATSSRNSGVIHAGIYYKPGSLKARACVLGRDLLYAYADARGVPFKRCGKLVVATDKAQIDQLKAWKKNAEDNGLTGLKLLSGEEAHHYEREVQCEAALLVPMTGIIDVHSYMFALLGDAEHAGASLALNAPVSAGKVEDDGFALDIGGEHPMQLSCRTLINAAGLGAQAFAHTLTGLDPATIPPQVLAKGNYFNLKGKSPFQMLVYPLPVLGSSGLHATCDLAGRTRFGPDVEWVDKIDYTVDPSRQAAFEESVRRYWPGLPKDALQPDYCGIRPKTARKSPHDTDFIVQTMRDHSVPNLVNLYGIESPGLTSSLALAAEVADHLKPA